MVFFDIGKRTKELQSLPSFPCNNFCSLRCRIINSPDVFLQKPDGAKEHL